MQETKNFLLSVLMILVSSLISPTVAIAQAYIKAEDLCKSRSRTIWISNLIKNGVTRVGDLDLIHLKSEMENLDCTVNLGPMVRSADGLRQSAINFPSNKRMIFNVPQQQHQEIRQDSLVLHESFGALGYNDANYQLTAALQSLDLRIYNKNLILNKEPYQPAIEESSKNSIKRLMDSPIFTNKILRQGGADAGGGDLYGAESKVEMLFEVDVVTGVDIARGRKPVVDYAKIESFILMANIEVEHGNHDESSMRIEKTGSGYTIYIPDTMYVVYKGQRRTPSDNGVKMIQDYLQAFSSTTSSQ